MAKKIEDWITNVSTTEMGVQVVLCIKRDPNFLGGKYHIHPGHPQWARYSAIASQVFRVLQLNPSIAKFVFADVQANKDFYHLLDIQLSYKSELCLKNSVKSSKRKQTSTRSQDSKSKLLTNSSKKKGSTQSSTKKHS